MAELPSRGQMLRNALADLERARTALADARDWLNSDWRPLGSPLTDAQADARTATRRVIATCKAEIDTATTELMHALHTTPEDPRG